MFACCLLLVWCDKSRRPRLDSGEPSTHTIIPKRPQQSASSHFEKAIVGQPFVCQSTMPSSTGYIGRPHLCLLLLQHGRLFPLLLRQLLLRRDRRLVDQTPYQCHINATSMPHQCHINRRSGRVAGSGRAKGKGKGSREIGAGVAYRNTRYTTVEGGNVNQYRSRTDQMLSSRHRENVTLNQRRPCRPLLTSSTTCDYFLLLQPASAPKNVPCCCMLVDAGSARYSSPQGARTNGFVSSWNSHLARGRLSNDSPTVRPSPSRLPGGSTHHRHTLGWAPLKTERGRVSAGMSSSINASHLKGGGRGFGSHGVGPDTPRKAQSQLYFLSGKRHKRTNIPLVHSYKESMPQKLPTPTGTPPKKDLEKAKSHPAGIHQPPTDSGARLHRHGEVTSPTIVRTSCRHLNYCCCSRKLNFAAALR